MPDAAPIRPPGQRHERVDALRGLAMLWMTAYHFGFDLNHFGFIAQDFYGNPAWTLQRSAIVSLFLFTAGMGQALAVQAGQGWPRFARRWLQIVACAVAVSLASWWMFPASWISFGVLHALALMLLLARWGLVAGWLRGPWPWVLGLLLLTAAPVLNAALQAADAPRLAAALDSRWLYGLGIITHKPYTEDYVPLLPWLGVLLLGVGAAQQLPRAVLAVPVRRPGRVLAVLGRWSLSYYMLHQPVLIGGLMLWLAL